MSAALRFDSSEPPLRVLADRKIGFGEPLEQLTVLSE